MLRATPIVFTQGDQFIKLWVHEMTRVFADRLVDETDCTWFYDNMVMVIGQELSRQWKKEEIFTVNPIFCCDFMSPGIDLEDRRYSLVDQQRKLEKTVADYMMEETPHLNLVLFRDALEHLCRIARVLSLDRGHILLVGVGGSGKKSLSTLASALAMAKREMISPRKDYKSKDFKEEIIRMMRIAGVDGKPVCFLFPDTHIIDDSFLEDVNNLLNTGEIPNLFAKKEDQDEIKRDLGEIIAKAKLDIEPWTFFVERVKQNLHICLAFSPVGDQLRTRMRMFPSLVNCCTIDWLNPWPDEALKTVA